MKGLISYPDVNQNKGVTEPLWIGHELLHICVLFLAFVADNGSMYFWDWKTGHNFQRLQAAAQPGSLDSEAGIFAMTFDQSSSRLITCEADKTIKIYKEDDTAVCWSDARAPAPLDFQRLSALAFISKLPAVSQQSSVSF